jgi:cold shock CspA family protein/ribosome-associated translation inhibitor RaiA
MQVPLELSFRNIEHSAEIEADVREKVDKLDEFYGRITACRVVVEAPHQHHHKGNIYHVRIYLSVPQLDIVVDRDPGAHHAHEDVHVAIRDAFDAARRQLQDAARKLRGATKTHESPPHGWVRDIFPSADDPHEGYGFIETPDGREVYFHAHSLLDVELGDLPSGVEVRFDEEAGENGPQATSVRLTGRHHHLVE